MVEAKHADPRLLGQRLTAARKARGVTQEQAAKHLGCSRPTLIAIEKGERRAKSDELVQLAAFYGRTLHELVRPGVETVPLEPHLRAVIDPTSKSADEIKTAITELERFAEDYRELERILKADPINAYPPEISLPKRGSLIDFAEDVAMRERNRLGLGNQPILKLRQMLEADVGLRVFHGGLPSKIAGMFAYTADLGFCVFINSKHPPERQRATLAHEYGHALTDRHKPGIDYLDGQGRKPATERFAEAFGLSFLLPASGVRRKFHEITTSTGDFQVADLCRLSNFYFVSVEAMTRRLEELDLIDKGTWTLLKEKGFKPRTASEGLGLVSHQPKPNEPYPQRYKFLAIQAFRKGEITEGQLSRFLRCDPVTAREIVAKYLEQSVVDPDGQVQAWRMPFEESLLNARS
jgi:Zn-dependent peptidase ImmA (M78 family)/DNA-binding XRE family transcriptional regulator